MKYLDNTKRKSFTQPEVGLEQSLNSLSRGQKKRQTKKQKYLKKQEMIQNSLQLHQEYKNSKTIENFYEIKEQLTMLEEEKWGGDIKIINVPKIKSNRSKKSTTVKEIENLNLVLQHPNFIKSPFEAIKEHLHNKLKEQAEELNRNMKQIKRQEIITNSKKKEDKKEAKKLFLLEKSRKRKIGKKGNFRTSIS